MKGSPSTGVPRAANVWPGSGDEADLATGQGVLVAVIDSGWDRARYDLRVVPGIGLVDPDDELAVRISDDDGDRIGHGTNCAELILRTAPRATILPLRVFGGRHETSIDHTCAALTLAAERGANVINMSLATLRTDALRPLYAACEQATRAGVLIVAAAFGSTRAGYPATFDNAIGVATVPLAHPTRHFYRLGAAVECTACGAPPDGPRRPRHDSRNRPRSSYAAARVSGLLALFREHHRTASLDEARSWLTAHAFAVTSEPT